MAGLTLGVLISGRGSNLQALIDACARADYPARIALAISNVAGAGGLARAEAAGIPTATIPHREFETREAFEAEITAALRRAGVELVCLAGFMRLLTPGFVEDWRDRLINIHPSLLPVYKGLDSHARALADGVRFTGCTVHFVRPEMDVGPIVAQAAVPVLEGDDEETLATRVLAAEHRCYPLAVRLIAEGRVRIVGERVSVDGAEGPERAVLNPLEG
ncbi:MAG: phosphoribosylglycinamide formyltransferase [Rhodospirillaceae bacterium]|jgi:phosphoribosylglycinamide formyltransferase 1|nr:phosphoribosylglycinamide formyltransferase [Rhodospirillaceae bacterium]